MFRIVKDPQFAAEVIVPPLPGETEGGSFTARFRVMPYEEANAAAQDGDEFFTRALLSCGDLADEDGKALPWNAETRAALLAQPHVRLAIVRTYFAAVNGIRTGN